MIKRSEILADDQWTLVYTDGSANQVRGWWQAGYGAWFGNSDERDVGLQVPEGEGQSVSRGELCGLLCALQRRRAGEQMVVVLNSQGDH